MISICPLLIEVSNAPLFKYLQGRNDLVKCAVAPTSFTNDVKYKRREGNLSAQIKSLKDNSLFFNSSQGLHYIRKGNDPVSDLLARQTS